MPRSYSRRKADLVWIMHPLLRTSGLRRIAVVGPENFITGGGQTAATFSRDVTLLAAHVSAGFQVQAPDDPVAQSSPGAGFLGFGISDNSGATLSLHPSDFSLVVPAVLMTADTSRTSPTYAYSITGGSRSKRRCRAGDHLVWDWYGAPVAPWGAGNDTEQPGFVRALYKLN